MPRRGYGNSTKRRYYPETYPYVIEYINPAGNKIKTVRRVEYYEGQKLRENFSTDYPGSKLLDVYEESKGPNRPDTRSKLEKRTDEIGNGSVAIGFKYMSGQIAIKDVVKYINDDRNWNKSTEESIARGAALAEEEGFAVKSRVQPVQGEIKLEGPVHKKTWDNKAAPNLFTRKKKVGDKYIYPEPYTSPAILARREKAEREKIAAAAMPPAKATKKKAAPAREHTRVATGKQSGRVLSKYDVTAINKKREPLKEKDATGSKRIRPTKGEIRAELPKHPTRQKFDIYNVSKHRHVKE